MYSDFHTTWFIQLGTFRNYGCTLAFFTSLPLEFIYFLGLKHLLSLRTINAATELTWEGAMRSPIVLLPPEIYLTYSAAENTKMRIL